MPPSSQHLVKNEIFKAVSDMEASLLALQTNSTYSSNVMSHHDQCRNVSEVSSQRTNFQPTQISSDSQTNQIDAIKENKNEEIA